MARLTLRIEHLMPGGKWQEVFGHACETDEEAMAYVARFGMPRPPTRADLETLPPVGMWPKKALDGMFAAAAKRWRDEWAKGPTMRAAPLKPESEESNPHG